MEDEEEKSKPNIIIDNGSKFIKAGLSGEEGPSVIFPSCIGYPKYASGMEDMSKNFSLEMMPKLKEMTLK